MNTQQHPPSFQLDSMELMATTAKRSPYAKCWVMENGQISFGNTIFETTFCSPDQPLPRYFDLEMGFDEHDWQHRWKLIHTLKQYETEALLQHTDATFVRYRLLFSPICYKGTDFLSVWMVEQPNDESVLAAQGESNALYAALNYSQDGLWDWNLVTNAVHYSEQAYRLWGYTPKEFSGTLAAFESVVHPDDFPDVQSAVFNHINHNEPYHVEYRVRCKSGEYRWFSSKGSCIRNEQGVAIRFVGINSDIHHLKSISHDLKQEREKYRMLLDAIPACIFHKDDRNNILVANKMACETIGLLRHKVEGKPTAMFFPQELATHYHKDDIEVIESGVARRNIIEPYKTMMGETRWVRTDKIPMSPDAQGIRTVLVLAFDVTDTVNATQTPLALLPPAP